MVPSERPLRKGNDSASDTTESVPLGAHFASPAPESEGLRLLKKKSYARIICVIRQADSQHRPLVPAPSQAHLTNFSPSKSAALSALGARCSLVTLVIMSTQGAASAFQHRRATELSHTLGNV